MSMARQTTDHDEIRSWIEQRQGRPARVRGGLGDGILRVDFGRPEEKLQEIDWNEFFRLFDCERLAFLYQDRLASGQVSRFNKFIDRT